jgi:hypothetical protein
MVYNGIGLEKILLSEGVRVVVGKSQARDGWIAD